MKDKIIKSLEKIDWDFADYVSSQFPHDINSIHWYPAAFVPQIPNILIEKLSSIGDTILDPFVGSGITLVEAARQKRQFFGVDSNPAAVDISRAKFIALSKEDNTWYQKVVAHIKQIKPTNNPSAYCREHGIDAEISKWFEPKTLCEILSIHEFISKERSKESRLLLKVILSSILNKSCSQREHYTYITDSCFPGQLIYMPAYKLFIKQVELVGFSVKETCKQFSLRYKEEWGASGNISLGDARQLGNSGIDNVDLVVTSPPYLAVNDYTRSMRLTYLLFPDGGTKEALETEIGPRRKRQRRDALGEYLTDIQLAFKATTSVVKREGFLALVFGQSRGKINKRINIVEFLKNFLTGQLGLELVFRQQRQYKFRRIQVPGIGQEEILIFKKR